MAVTTAHVSEEEYLGTTYHPDCDYVDGELLERNLGEWDHGELQAAVGSYFVARRKRWNIHTAIAPRVRTGPSRYRIPDVCIVLLCIEVLSRSEYRANIEARIADFREFGVPHVWFIDPSEPSVKSQVLRAGEIAVPMEELFD